MSEVEQLLDQVYFHNTLAKWTIAAALAAGLFCIMLLVRRIVHSRYQRLADTPQMEFMELPLKVASRTTVSFLLITSLYLGLQVLKLPPQTNAPLLTIITIAAFWQVGVWASVALRTWLQYKQRSARAKDLAAAGSFGIIGFVGRTMIWALVLLLTLDNLGIQIKPLLAGLGIGGIAVALAVQNVLGDLLASLSITLDRPFVVGDAIAVGDFNGTVEQIGIKSVRLRSVNGEQIVMSNADLLSSRLRNFGRMRERRISFTVSLALDSAPEKLRQIPAALRAIVEAESDVRFDRSHFARISAGALEFETVYFVTTANYLRYMDIQQNINFNVIQLLDREQLDLAVPVQRVWGESGNMAAATPKPA